MALLIYIGSDTVPPIGGIDEYTKLMLHGDEDPLEDSSLSTHTVNMYNNVSRSAVQSKFGGYSIYFNPGASADYMMIPDSDDWYVGAGDHTIDFWIRFGTLPTVQQFFFNQRVNADVAHELSVDQSGNLKWAAFNNETLFDFSRTITLVINTWHHIAAVRDSNSMRLFFDGVQVGGAESFSGALPNYNANLDIGRWSGGALYLEDAYMDELRISKGIARWTSNFTPETGPYTE